MISNLETNSKEKQKLSRAFLYKLVAENLYLFDEFLVLKQNKSFIVDIFKDSAAFISVFEKDIDNKKHYNFKEFSLLVSNAFKKVKNDSFKEYLSCNLQELFNKKAKGERISYKNIVKLLLDELITYQNIVLEKNYRKVWFYPDNTKSTSNYPQIFLSYAFTDRGLTMGLFVYFFLNGAFLYVNWMWCGAESNSAITKKELDRQLSNSKQFLFLRTTNSELRIAGNHQVRQWCSWEIGNYYSKHIGGKFYINFYGAVPSSNDILSTFNIFHYVSNGVMY